MLNSQKYDEKILNFEKGLASNAKKKTEKLKEVEKAKKSNKKCLVGLLALVLLFGFMALAIFYAPVREFCFNLLKIDINNFSPYPDMVKLIGVIVAFIVIQVIILAFATDGTTAWAFVSGSLMFGGVPFLFLGFYFLLAEIADNNRRKRSVKKELKPLVEASQKIQKNLDEARKQKEEETEKLAETDEMFRRGQEENDWNLIQKAAELGNPKAMMAEGKRLYEQAVQLEETDRSLLEKAADFGYPSAIFDLAELWLDEANSDMMTKTEKSKVLIKVDSYVKEADFTGHPDGRMLQLSRLVYSTDKNEKKDYQKLLEEVRTLKSENKLSDKYKNFADIMIKQLVSEIDRMELYKRR